jgi:hypothetical protein
VSIGLILVALLALAALAWVSSVRQARGGDMAPGIGRLFAGAGTEPHGMEPSGMDLGSSGPGMASSGGMSLPLFLVMWSR